MKKTYVLDTNVLLTDPKAIFSYEEHDVVLPFTVLEELDKFKIQQNELGVNAREVSRQISDLIKKTSGNLRTGIKLPGGGSIIAVSSSEFNPNLPKELKPDKNDNIILSVCADLKGSILVTNDLILRIIADGCGIKAEEYRKLSASSGLKGRYSGLQNVQVEKEQLAELWRCSHLSEDLSNEIEKIAPDLLPNEFVHIKNGEASKPFIARSCGNGVKFVPEYCELPRIKPRNLEQRLALDLLMDPKINLVTLVGIAGSGKAQPLDAKILTSTGWTTMGSMKIGDEVIGKYGQPAVVTGVFPQGKKKIYKIEFSDGSSTHCCEEHLWLTQTSSERGQGKPGKVRSTKEVMSTLWDGKQQKKNHSIPMVSPVQFKKQEVPIDPYVLGVLLGDGCLRHNQISISSADPEIIREVELSLPTNFSLRKKYHSKYDYSIIAAVSPKERYNQTTKWVVKSPQGDDFIVESPVQFAKQHNLCMSSFYRMLNGQYKQHKGWVLKRKFINISDVKSKIIKELIRLNLMDSYSYQKFIPDLYKYNSIEARTAMLQGLMDTDGFVNKTGTSVIFYSTSNRLACDVQELVWSLGGKAVICNKQTSYTHKKKKRKGRPSFAVHISMPPKIIPFRLRRKRERFVPRTKRLPMRYITSVNLVGIRPAQCIMVNNPEHLYVTDDYIVTHNTLLTLAAGLEQVVDKRKYRSLVVLRPVQPLGKDIGYLPGNIEEKMEPWIAPIKDNLRFLLLSGGDRKSKYNEDSLNYYFERGIIEVEALTYIRGRSIAEAYIIIDEAQNLSAHELKTIITRVGDGTKIILTGDVEQIDNTSVDSVSNGLAVAVERFKKHSIAGHVTLTKGERSSLATLAARIL